MAEHDRNTLECAIGYRFQSEKLLLQALTHRSLSYEQETQRSGRESDAANVDDNERLEFLGDAILGFVVAESLFREFPHFHEGEWTRLRADLVSRRSLAQVAARFNLGDFLRLGRGEERSGGRNKAALLANATEALIAAIHLDGGLSSATRFIEQHILTPSMGRIRDALAAGTSLGDHKSDLQELLQAHKAGTPRYVLEAAEGPDHHKHFIVEVRTSSGQDLPSTIAIGRGSTKKKAEQEAARQAVEKLRSALQPRG